MRAALPGSDVVDHLEPRRHDLDLRDRVLTAALAEPLVRDVHDIAIYKHAGRASVSLHLKLDPDVPLAEAHEVASGSRRRSRADPRVDDVYAHLEPLERPLAVSDKAAASDEIEREPSRGRHW